MCYDIMRRSTHVIAAKVKIQNIEYLEAKTFNQDIKMTLIDLLKIAGIDTTKNIKILRHTGTEAVMKLFRENRDILEKYQAVQNAKALNCDYVVSCLVENNKTVVQAVYTVDGHRPVTRADILDDEVFAAELELIETGEYTVLSRVENFADLEGRIVVDWGKSAVSWRQSLNNHPKRVIEVRAKGKIEEFLDYDNVLLNYHQLKEMIDNPEANQEWHQMLSVNGIYLMTNNKTGQQYVGSAYGKHGILGRWNDYAKNGHGGNVRLQRLLDGNPSLLFDMQYSILTTVASNKTPTEIVAIENFYKRKLGKSAVTLNHEGFSSENVKFQCRKSLLDSLLQFMANMNQPIMLPLQDHYEMIIDSANNRLVYHFISNEVGSESLVLGWEKGVEKIYLEFDLYGYRHYLNQLEYQQKIANLLA
jgi:hypothetical protein